MALRTPLWQSGRRSVGAHRHSVDAFGGGSADADAMTPTDCFSDPPPGFGLHGRRVLVTGASAGVGRGVAQVLATQGAIIIATGRDAGRLQETLATLSPGHHAAEVCDLADLDRVPARLKSITTTHGALDGLAHCAGVQAMRPVRSFTAAHFDELLRTNLGSIFALARGLRQKGCHAPRASMAIVASVAGMKALPGNLVYGASKAGALLAAQGLALELLPDGIRVNAVAPAMVDTDLIRRLKTTLSADQFDQLLARQPLGLGQPEDVGHAIAYLLSDAARHVTGTTLTVDGGATACT